ncbi:condensation domain-containing protein [Streptomyces lydicus]|nr:condensation domain-containing protein [Streptomyces lydicus]
MYFDCGPDLPAQLVVTVHHLVVDGVSWRILLGDLEAAYRDAAAGRAPALAPASSGYGHWAARLEQHARSGALDGDLAYWTRACRAPAACPPTARDPTPTAPPPPSPSAWTAPRPKPCCARSPTSTAPRSTTSCSAPSAAP